MFLEWGVEIKKDRETRVGGERRQKEMEMVKVGKKDGPFLLWDKNESGEMGLAMAELIPAASILYGKWGECENRISVT